MGSPMDDKEAKNEEQMWCSPGSELAEASENSGPKTGWKNPEGGTEYRSMMKIGEEGGVSNQMMKSGQLSQQPLKFFDPLLSPITEYEMGSPMDDKEAKNEEQMWCSPGSELAEASESSGPNKIFFKINFLLFNK